LSLPFQTWHLIFPHTPRRSTDRDPDAGALALFMMLSAALAGLIESNGVEEAEVRRR
jgi:hypothetical protein